MDQVLLLLCQLLKFTFKRVGLSNASQIMLNSSEKSPNVTDTAKLQLIPLRSRDDMVLIGICPENYLSFSCTFTPALGEVTKTAIPTWNNRIWGLILYSIIETINLLINNVILSLYAYYLAKTEYNTPKLQKNGEDNLYIINGAKKLVYFIKPGSKSLDFVPLALLCSKEIWSSAYNFCGPIAGQVVRSTGEGSKKWRKVKELKRQDRERLIEFTDLATWRQIKEHGFSLVLTSNSCMSKFFLWGLSWSKSAERQETNLYFLYTFLWVSWEFCNVVSVLLLKIILV